MPFYKKFDKNRICIQDKNILLKGTVLDKATNSPIPYASLSVVDGKTYTQANTNGAFALSLKPEYQNGKIRVTMLGYITQEFSIADLIKQNTTQKEIKLFLVPDYKSLKTVEVHAKARKWKIKKVGYHIDEGASMHYEFYPSDTIKVASSGQEIGNNIHLNQYPAALRSVSFGLAGLSGVKLLIRVRLYSLKDNLPHLDLLPESAIIAIPPHHAGWITVNLQEYNIKLKEDFAVVVQWLNESKERNNSSLMAYASIPKGQIIYYRESSLKPWQIVKSTLIDVNSIGMYVTVLYEK